MIEERVSLRQSVTWGVITFSVALAVVIGVRLDQAALAAVVGVICGVAASVPTSLLIISLMRRQDARRERREVRDDYDPYYQGAKEWERRRMAQVPQVVVVAPPTVPQLPQQVGWAGEYNSPLPAQRRFAVIGEEGIDDELDGWE